MKRNCFILCTLAALSLAGCNDTVEWEGKVESICGNGVIEAGEQCDTTVRVTCDYYDSKQVWASGTPGCSSDCKLTQGTCVAATTPGTATCGNGIIEAGEQCDVTVNVSCSAYDPSQNWVSGTPGCTSDCKLMQGSCMAEPVVATCGNGTLDDGEACDGDLIPESVSCVDVKGEGATGTVSCLGCQLDYSACEAAPIPETCGNGDLDEGEACDGELIPETVSCADEKGEGATGEVTCSEACQLDYSACEAAPVPETCGNGELDEDEECDGDDTITKTCADYAGEGATGELTCDDTCKIVSSACVAAPVCGDGTINGEDECEGEDFGGKTCVDYKGTGATGELKCTECKIDSSACEEAPAPETCPNGTIDEGEECDGTALADGVAVCDEGYKRVSETSFTCRDNCTIDKEASCKAACNDGVLDEGEECDTDNFNEKTCASILNVPAIAASGELTCSSTCTIDSGACVKLPYCGDGIINNEEDCDGDAEITKTCADLDANTAGPLTCSDTCTFVTDACAEVVKCGNGTIDEGEDCDGSNLNGKTCSAALGVDATGDLTCDDTCHFVTTACVPVCGNGNIDAGEECDNTNLNNATCSDLLGVPASGTPSCSSECKLVQDDCAPLCGNGTIDGDEECDDTDFGTVTCSDMIGEAASGALACDSECKIVSTDCAPLCGNGVVDEGETCDGDAFAEGAAAVCAEGSAQTTLVCAATGCVIDNDASCEVIPETCDNSVMDDGEVCDISLNEYTPVSCAYVDASFQKAIFSTAKELWIGTNTCSAVCALSSDCKKYEESEVLLEVVMDKTLNAKTINSTNENGENVFDSLRFAREGFSLGGNLNYKYDSSTGKMAYNFGSWTKATKNLPNLTKYLRYNILAINSSSFKEEGVQPIEDYDYVSIAIDVGRVNANSIEKMAIMLYDGDTLISKVADITPGPQPWHLVNTGEIVFSIKGLEIPNIRFVNTDADHTGNVWLKDLHVSGINIK
ncbi:MAG: hypothetical protein J6A01_09625 [Proteobacteria bacterium]|nr:hypothetical protein [Pseudomonadota bacterium]